MKAPLTVKLTLALGLPIVIVTVLFTGLTFRWQYSLAIQQSKETASALAEQEVFTRSLIAHYGGVWVVDGTGLRREGDKVLKSPAMITKEVGRRGSEAGEFTLHLTSDRLRNAANAPSPLERQALAAFAAGDTSPFVRVTRDGEERYLTYITPLYAEQSCLACHADQGYRAGDLRGALTVSVPLSATDAILRRMLAADLIVGGVLLAGLLYLLRWQVSRLVLRPLNRLDECAVRWARQERQVRANLHTGDEFERVGAAFDYMAGRLDATRRTIVELAEREKALATANTALRELAYRDALTGLYNRRYLNDRLAAITSGADGDPRPFALVILDIDYFKKVNDQYGHLAGDQVLRELAGLLREQLRDADEPVRYGGEEFAALLFGVGKDEAREVAERLREKAAAGTFTIDGHQLRLTVSAGVAAFPDDAAYPEQLIAAADAALYRAKEGGRNRVCVAEASDRRS